MAAPAQSARIRERAVFGLRPGTAQPLPNAPAAIPSPGAPPIADVTSQNGEVPADILGFLERWRTSLIRGDMAAHVDTYAPRVERFFRERYVSRERVRDEKRRLLERYPNVNRYELRNVKLESRTGDRAVVTFRKDWDTSGRERFAGSEAQRLTLERAGATWQIVREEEIKVYWVHRN